MFAKNAFLSVFSVATCWLVVELVLVKHVVNVRMAASHWEARV